MKDDAFAYTYGVELLCEAPPRIVKAVLLERLRARLPDVVPLNEEDGGLFFVHPKVIVQLSDARLPAQTVVMPSDKPFDARHLAPALAQTWEFDGARDAVGRATATLVITDLMSSGLEARKRLDLIQGTLRAVIDVAPEVLAIHWARSQRIVDPRAWAARYDEKVAARLFFAGAVNVRMFKVGESSDLIMDTLGLAALGLPDLQCHFRGLEPSSIASFLYNTSWYIFTEGDIIHDGHTIEGPQSGSTWRCRHEEALAPPARVVLDIDPGGANSAGKR